MKKTPYLSLPGSALELSRQQAAVILRSSRRISRPERLPHRQYRIGRPSVLIVVGP